jgi:hypothetical protein
VPPHCVVVPRRGLPRLCRRGHARRPLRAPTNHRVRGEGRWGRHRADSICVVVPRIKPRRRREELFTVETSKSSIAGGRMHASAQGPDLATASSSSRGRAAGSTAVVVASAPAPPHTGLRWCSLLPAAVRRPRALRLGPPESRFAPTLLRPPRALTPDRGRPLTALRLRPPCRGSPELSDDGEGAGRAGVRRGGLHQRRPREAEQGG